MKRLMTGMRMLAMLALVGAAVGCVSSATSPRLARYRPSVGSGDRMRWEKNSSGIPDAVKSAPAGLQPGKPSSDASAPRRLRNGDRIIINKLGISPPEEIKDVIDENGSVTLSFVGPIKLEGLTTAEAEDAIEKAYIDGGYYKKINIVVVPQEYQYYVSGEVMKPGRYPLVAGTTLLRAITAAGGYTEYANPRKITVRRGDKVDTYNAKKIEDLKQDDPVLEPEDVLVVERTGWL